MPEPRALTKRLRAAWRDYDVVSLGLLALQRTCRRAGLPLAVHTYRLVAQPVRPVRVPTRRAARFQTRFLERGAPELAALPRPEPIIEQRFDQGARCLGLFQGERLVGCAWFCLGPYLEDEVRCRFEPQPAGETAWDFDVYIEEDFRLGFAFAILWAAVNDRFGHWGVRWTMSRISTLNPASLRAHARLGAVPLARAVYLSLGRLQLMLATVSPWIHVGAKADSIPTLCLRAPADRGLGQPENAANQ